MNIIYPSELAPIIRALAAPVAGVPLPSLPPAAMPKGIESHPVGIPYDDRPLRDLIREVNERLEAEYARLRRLLPPAPYGYRWEGQITTDDRFDWVDMSASHAYRLRYRLNPIGSRDG